MTRLIATLLVAGLAALAAIWLADHDGTVQSRRLCVDGEEGRRRVHHRARVARPSRYWAKRAALKELPRDETTM